MASKGGVTLAVNQKGTKKALGDAAIYAAKVHLKKNNK